MLNLVRFPGDRNGRPQSGRRAKNVYFNQQELRQLLNVYGRRVAIGEWRDYAIDYGPDGAVFSIFRHTHESPVFSIAKIGGPSARMGRYCVQSGPRTLKRGQDLGDVLAVLERRLAPVV